MYNQYTEDEANLCTADHLDHLYVVQSLKDSVMNSIQRQPAIPCRDREFANRSTMMTGEHLAGVAIVFFLRYETRDLTILRKNSRVPQASSPLNKTLAT